ncbi:ParB/RepB/Spo0J family partition protein [Defluviicoccus vanus]|uniref:ParB/RepB/Spo0J family partition protein n=1 Tax=Defluviicoccus vanus TaxID=111831 RepID=A0A7H1N1M0_9PROT|nr:ParB/RepB/Spo0J family partition protein [Defluviicoccus vanus]QNT69606.1 ParB/RepB/Spo0J family partition protein [Defluviicoccus vanus]
MSTEPKRRTTLGRGLSALIGDDSEDYAELDRLRSPRTVSIDQLRPNPNQPRRRMKEEYLEELAQSIVEKGILQPLIVRRLPDDPSSFEIVAGERRWRAAQRAQQHDIPVIIKDMTDAEALEVALIENLQRQDLSPLEEAEGYRRLLEEFNHTQEVLAKVVGKSRSHVANMLRLLTLPDPVKSMLDTGTLTAGHARALLTAEDPIALAEQVVKGGLNVRTTEELVRAGKEQPREANPVPNVPSTTRRSPIGKDPNTESLERDLSALLGLRVEIRFQGSGGSLTLHYHNLDQLDDILLRLNQPQATPRSAVTAIDAALDVSDIDDALASDDPFGSAVG